MPSLNRRQPSFPDAGVIQSFFAYFLFSGQKCHFIQESTADSPELLSHCPEFIIRSRESLIHSRQSVTDSTE